MSGYARAFETRGGLFEVSIDIRQWILGFNAYPPKSTGYRFVNVFLGPLRLGWVWS